MSRIRSLLADAKIRLQPAEYARFAAQFEAELKRVSSEVFEYERCLELTAIESVQNFLYLRSSPMMARTLVWQAAFFAGSGTTPVGGVVNASGQLSEHPSRLNFQVCSHPNFMDAVDFSSEAAYLCTA